MAERNEIDAWIRDLRTDDMETRREMSKRLGAAGPSAVGPLIEALIDSDDNDERWYLAVALARIGPPAIAPLVEAMTERHDNDFRRYVAATLAEFGADAVDPLIHLLEVEDDAELRGFASRALNRIGDPAIEPLQRTVESGGTLGAVAGLVLWQMEAPGVEALVGICCPDDDACNSEGSGSTGPQA
jgi:HEAT repeat protein